MQSTASRIRRALVHRHTPAGRAFWSEVAQAVGGDVQVLGAMLDLASRSSAAGPTTVASWLDQAGGPVHAVPTVETALRSLTVPTTRTRHGMGRIRKLVRGATAFTLIRSDVPATV